MLSGSTAAPIGRDRSGLAGHDGVRRRTLVCQVARDASRPALSSCSRGAYDEGQWADAADLARQTLAVRKDDPAALRLLARASVRLGRDDAALAIYQRRLDEKALEAEDHVLLGLVYQRQGRADAAARAWKKVLEAGEVSPRSLDELGRLHIQGHRWEEAIRVDRAARPATGLGGTGVDDARHDSRRAQ